MSNMIPLNRESITMSLSHKLTHNDKSFLRHPHVLQIEGTNHRNVDQNGNHIDAHLATSTILRHEGIT